MRGDGTKAIDPEPLEADGEPWIGGTFSTSAVVGAVVAVVGGCIRWWTKDGAPPLLWNDSADYVAGASTALLSTDRLMGARPPLTSWVLSAVGGDLERFVTLQTLVAAVAWGVLAAATAQALTGVWRQAAMGSLVLGLSVTWPVAMWDQQVLSESLALSLFALVLAALIRFLQEPNPVRAITLVLVAGLWLATRDSHVIPVALGGLAMLIWALRSPLPRRRVLMFTAGYLMAGCLLVIATSQHGHRDRQPLEHVFAARILPYPDRVDWFSDRGMPDGEKISAIPDVLDPAGEKAPFKPLAPGPELAEWRTWLVEDGRAAYMAYVVSHPTYLVTEPAKDPERVFNNGDGLVTYRPLYMPLVPGVTTFGYPPVLTSVILAAAGAGLIRRRGLGWMGLPLAAAAVLITAGPHALVVWHGDGMESARHLLMAGLQLRVAAWLLLAYGVLATGGVSLRAVIGIDRSPPAQ